MNDQAITVIGAEAAYTKEGNAQCHILRRHRAAQVEREQASSQRTAASF